jgi:hypothetical protein
MSLRAFVRMLGMPSAWESVTALEHSVRTGEPGVRTLDPGGLWAYLESHPRESAISSRL